MKLVSELTVKQLEDLIRKITKEVLEEYRIEAILAATPYVSDEEQKDIEKAFGESPSEDEIVCEKEIEI